MHRQYISQNSKYPAFHFTIARDLKNKIPQHFTCRHNKKLFLAINLLLTTVIEQRRTRWEIMRIEHQATFFTHQHI
jgi:hypothetical protein